MTRKSLYYKVFEDNILLYSRSPLKTNNHINFRSTSGLTYYCKSGMHHRLAVYHTWICTFEWVLYNCILVVLSEHSFSISDPIYILIRPYRVLTYLCWVHVPKVHSHDKAQNCFIGSLMNH